MQTSSAGMSVFFNSLTLKQRQLLFLAALHTMIDPEKMLALSIALSVDTETIVILAIKLSKMVNQEELNAYLREIGEA